MQLRASGHHALPEDEQELMNTLVQRAHEVHDHRIAAEAVEDADDTDAELGAEGVPLDGDDAGDVYVTVCEEVKDTVPATLRAEAGDGAEASEHATAVEAGDWVEFIAAAVAEEDAAREEVPPAEERRAAIKATAAPLRRPPEEGFQDLEEITQWHPRRRVLTVEEKQQEQLFLQLSAQANSMLGLPTTLSDVTRSMPSFLVDTADDSSSAAAPAAASEGLERSARKPRKRPAEGRGRWPPREEQRMLRLGVVGIPNAGKSTLTNALVGGTVSAVSVRPETTRQPALGCFTDDLSQVAIYDTPGMRGTKDYETRSQAMRVGATWQHVQECDLLALLVDAEAFSRRSRRKPTGRGNPRESGAKTRDFRQQTLEIAEALGAKRGPRGFGHAWTPIPVILVVNKADTLAGKPAELLSIVKQLSKACEFRRVFFTCAATTAAVAPLREHLAAAARPAAWEFEPAAPTEMTWPQLAAELVREKLYWSHNHEVPYRLRPVCRRFSLAPDGNAVVLVDIPVASVRLKARVTGVKGERVERLQQRVGAELAHMMRRRVEVTVRVKVRTGHQLPPMEL